MLYGLLDIEIKQLAGDANISFRLHRRAGSSHGLRLPTHALEIDSLLCCVMYIGGMNLLLFYPKNIHDLPNRSPVSTILYIYIYRYMEKAFYICMLQFDV